MFTIARLDQLRKMTHELVVSRLARVDNDADVVGYLEDLMLTPVHLMTNPRTIINLCETMTSSPKLLEFILSVGSEINIRLTCSDLRRETVIDMLAEGLTMLTDGTSLSLLPVQVNEAIHVNKEQLTQDLTSNGWLTILILIRISLQEII